jgi:histidinol-phosphate/aromatic aminotransferase/cobyric acid decarboxylase-like protein/GNAT superfamily N-acetyltransferase
MKINLPVLERPATRLTDSVPPRVNGVKASLGKRLTTRSRVRLALATGRDREAIYRLRHDVYARELAQHGQNEEGRLCDALDAFNTYLVATVEGKIVGFISVTPPGQGSYSMDKYVERERLPFPFDRHLYEVRLLTVVPECRGRQIAVLLMYAAFRWVEAHGGTRIMAIGRREVLDLYLKAGLQTVGHTVRAGAVTFEVVQTAVHALRSRLEKFTDVLGKVGREIDWQLGIPFQKPAACFHGGAFFARIGERFEALERIRTTINADVLDAWFPPSPRVLEVLREHLPWLLRTSPPTGCRGLIEAIAEARGVPADCVLPGAGSSDLIFLALRQWLKGSSRALILDPTYGEYAHVMERVIRCRVDRLVLSRENHYDVDLAELEAKLTSNYDLVVLVNPNSPTGRHIPRVSLEKLLRRVPAGTRVWVDETYVEYAGADQSLERFAARAENVIVCKSMSKVYALSGARAAYLCASPHQLEELRSVTPPWAVSLPAQVAAVLALQDPEYYARRYAETHRLREQLAAGLAALGVEALPGVANFILCHLPPAGPTAATVVARCRERDLFLRDASAMGSRLGPHALRLAVKDEATNRRMLEILAGVLEC